MDTSGPVPVPFRSSESDALFKGDRIWQRHASCEFKKDAVRIALTSGLTRRQVASDLGVGLSTLGKWIRAISDEAKMPERDSDLLRENERLRKENRILRDLSRNRKQSGGLFSRRMWEVLKKTAQFFAAQKP